MSVGDDALDHSLFDAAQTLQQQFVIVGLDEGIAGNPSSLWVVALGGVGRGRVVIGSADDHRASPRSNVPESRPPQLSCFIRLRQIVHLAVVSGLNPGREVVELPKRRSRCNAGERKALIERRVFDEFRKQRHRVTSGQ